jgi:hypothetical protein
MLNEGLATKSTSNAGPHNSLIKYEALRPDGLETTDLFVTILSTPDVTRNRQQMSSHSYSEATVTRSLQASLSLCRRDAQHSHQLHATLSFIPDKLTVTQIVKKIPNLLWYTKTQYRVLKGQSNGPYSQPD